MRRNTYVCINVNQLQQALANIPTFAGVKFTGWDMGTAIEAKRRFGDKVLIGYGKDEQAVAAYFLGVRFK